MSVIDDILTREGWPQFTDQDNDRGGPSRGGITIPVLARHRGQPVTVDDLRAMKETEARAIYEQKFIKEPGFDAIQDEKLREYAIDTAVTSGAPRATRYLQYVLGLKQDAVLGPITRGAIQAADPKETLLRLIARRCRMIAADVQNNPKQIVYLEGWVNRATAPLLD